MRGAKYLPTAEDLKVNTKIAGNEFMWATLSEKTFVEKIKEDKLERFVDEEWIKKLYIQLAKSEEYIAYIEKQDRQPASEKAIMQYIWEKLVLENESLQEHFLDELPDWEDDKDMTTLLMQNFFKNNNQKINYLDLVSAEKRDYAHNLLRTVVDKEEHCMSLIKPKLVNWDTERVALIDQLLLRMGVSELLYFPTIPTKVTINEYIEIGKLYSTPQSGQFINGVLDNILKDLTKEQKIVKEERPRKS
jgi:N utilization substance protein B